jgi:hypothetical protein
MSHTKFTNVPSGHARSNRSKLSAGALALASSVSMGIGSAQASTLTLSDTTTSTGTTSSGITSNLATPGTFTYADSFGAGVGSTPVAGKADGFFDDYIFTVGGTTADSVTSTIDLSNMLQISGLQVALFSIVPGESVPLFGKTLPAGSTDLTGWSSPLGSGVSGSVSVIPATQLAAGTYALEIRGTVTGTAGGSYSGQLNLATTPVPLPASLWLMLSGLGGLGVLSMKRRAA